MKTAIIILLSVAPLMADPIEWKISEGGNGHSYELVGNFNNFTNRWNWETCRRMAWASGGHLATITSEAENQFVITKVMRTNSLPTWIGLTDRTEYGGHDFKGLVNPQTNGWVWITGEPVQYTFWQGRQPDLEQLNQNCAAIGSYLTKTFGWDNFQQGDTCQFLIEYENLAARINKAQIEIVWPTFTTNICHIESSTDLKSWRMEEQILPLEKLSVRQTGNFGSSKFYRLAFP